MRRRLAPLRHAPLVFLILAVGSFLASIGCAIAGMILGDPFLAFIAGLLIVVTAVCGGLVLIAGLIVFTQSFDA